MSIATREADRLYPIRHNNMMAGDITDAMQPAIDALRNEAYVKGRTAPPCDAQVEAVAKYLCDTEDWNQLNSVERGAYRATAWELLEIAWKTVSDPSRKQRKKEEK